MFITQIATVCSFSLVAKQERPAVLYWTLTQGREGLQRGHIGRKMNTQGGTGNKKVSDLPETMAAATNSHAVLCRRVYDGQGGSDHEVSVWFTFDVPDDEVTREGEVVEGKTKDESLLLSDPVLKPAQRSGQYASITPTFLEAKPPNTLSHWSAQQ